MHSTNLTNDDLRVGGPSFLHVTGQINNVLRRISCRVLSNLLLNSLDMIMYPDALVAITD